MIFPWYFQKFQTHLVLDGFSWNLCNGERLLWRKWRISLSVRLFMIIEILQLYFCYDIDSFCDFGMCAATIDILTCNIFCWGKGILFPQDSETENSVLYCTDSASGRVHLIIIFCWLKWDWKYCWTQGSTALFPWSKILRRFDYQSH